MICVIIYYSILHCISGGQNRRGLFFAQSCVPTLGSTARIYPYTPTLYGFIDIEMSYYNIVYYFVSLSTVSVFVRSPAHALFHS